MSIPVARRRTARSPGSSALSVSTIRGGVSASSQPLSINTTTPIAASALNARRKRSASGTVISCALARRADTIWRAVTATNTIAATATALSSNTRPWPLLNSEPPSRRMSWMTPVMMVPRIAGSEMRLKPRTACTRSSSPGPASTTRATSATPPTHTAGRQRMADAGEHADQRASRRPSGSARRPRWRATGCRTRAAVSSGR